MSQRKAYREAFKQSVKWKDTTVDVNASKLFSDTKVLLRYNELQEEAKDEAILSRKDRMVTLSGIATDEYENTSDRIKAIDTLNKMDNAYVHKLELSGEVTNSNPLAGLSEEELRRLANGESG